MQQKRRNQAGFTLIEIMVVIVILGILAAMVMPSVLGNKDKAQQQKVISDITTLEGAMDMFKLDNNRFPTTDQGLEALVSKPEMDPVPRNYPQAGYIKRLPNDPWGNPYLLLSPGENGQYDIFSAGLDGEEGTDDDIGNWNMHDLAEQE
ncbi:type II secretion system major pseudopilin GspG [Psychrobium sp. 1_MG-2023]|uniref:type II secretion system major pseudopilin GspG n=1 Tax=Psychrobium sp. 1_MG-2023 TaxID=3062624 RepID=UPI000C3443C5|nr:type II secretion system major pseudopilin GspG [Psychrobium sp. 1_MG-2023]MDP2561934.1 type II secretion system major pseudopilin GspG [Psychrobium sp. 1_MG-2023]PKF58683.1 type II secretion system protein GspG [Alteromonadales bacterium alter-6D02]